MTTCNCFCCVKGYARARIATLEAERDAYKRAKAENDERFMTEREEALAALARVEGERARAEHLAFIEGRDIAIDNAAMCAYDMGHPDVRRAINALITDAHAHTTCPGCPPTPAAPPAAPPTTGEALPCVCPFPCDIATAAHALCPACATQEATGEAPATCGNYADHGFGGGAGCTQRRGHDGDCGEAPAVCGTCRGSGLRPSDALHVRLNVDATCRDCGGTGRAPGGTGS